MMRRCFPFLCFALTLALAGPLPAATPQKTPPKKATVSTSPASKKTPAKPKTVPKEAYAVDPSGAAPKLRVASAILIDANTGEVLLENNPDSRRPVASTQKLLTALMVAETGNLSQDVRVESVDTWTEPS